MWKENEKKPIIEYLFWTFGISWSLIYLIIGIEHLQVLPVGTEKAIVMLLIGFGAGLSPAYAVYIILRKYKHIKFKEFIKRIFECKNRRLTALTISILMIAQLVKCMLTEQYLGEPIYLFIYLSSCCQ